MKLSGLIILEPPIHNNQFSVVETRYPLLSVSRMEEGHKT